jgi:hypothetical protein
VKPLRSFRVGGGSVCLLAPSGAFGSSQSLRGKLSRHLVAGILGLFAAASFSPAGAAKISISEYRERLVGIRVRIDSGDWAGAGLASRELIGDRVALPRAAEEVAPDASLLGPIGRASNLAEARGPGGEHVRRLNRLAADLAVVADNGGSSGPIVADRTRLEHLRARQRLADLPDGGALPKAGVPEGTIDALTDFFAPLTRVLRAIGRKILDWLDRLFSRKKSKADGAVSNLAIAVAVVIALALAGAAILYVRRRRKVRGPGAPEEAPAPPATDDDPLSREVGEWERYARELERAGRTREAVRAWYHAVLVALYRTGFVHYRRGRTNWEYVASLAPTLSVRAGFADLTRRFEREWYGRDESDLEALAAAAEVAGGLLGTVRDLAGSPG